MQLLKVTEIFLFKWMTETSILSEKIKIYHRKIWLKAFIDRQLKGRDFDSGFL